MKKQIDVFKKSQHDCSDWPPDHAIGFIKWFQQKLESIPEEYRQSADISVSSEYGYEDSSYIEIYISYSREETAEESAAREARSAKQKTDEIAHLEAALARAKRS